MHPATIDTVEPADLADSLPWRIDQTPSRRAALVRLLLLLPPLLALALPFGLVGILAIDNPAILLAVADKPVSAALLVLGLLIVASLIGAGLSQAVRALGRHRRVVITEGFVLAVDRGPTGQSVWSSPLSSYQGLAHQTRTSVGGLRHELLLVHPDATRSVLLHVGETLPTVQLARAQALLKLPALAPSASGTLPKSLPMPPVAEPSAVALARASG